MTLPSRLGFPVVLSILVGASAFGCGGLGAPGGGTSTGGATTGGGGATSGGGSASGGMNATGGGNGFADNCSPGGCSLVSATCCGSCGVPTTSDVIAVRKGAEGDYSNSVCLGDIACPACASSPNPNLFAVCVGSAPDVPQKCEVADLTSRPEAKCAVDADCVVKPRACCECGADDSAGNLVALRADGLSFLNDSLCEPNQACDECAWVAPPEVSAACDEGVCIVKDTRATPF